MASQSGELHDPPSRGKYATSTDAFGSAGQSYPYRYRFSPARLNLTQLRTLWAMQEVGGSFTGSDISGLPWGAATDLGNMGFAEINQRTGHAEITTEGEALLADPRTPLAPTKFALLMLAELSGIGPFRSYHWDLFTTDPTHSIIRIGVLTPDGVEELPDLLTYERPADLDSRRVTVLKPEGRASYGQWKFNRAAFTWLAQTVLPMLGVHGSETREAAHAYLAKYAS